MSVEPAPSAGDLPTVGGDPADPPPRPPAGVVGRYAVGALHARGGLGEVYVATDTELNREVALKRIQDRYADQARSRRRFLAEAEVTARLDHPGVVPVFGLVSDPAGRPCYAMRFVRGDTLLDQIAAHHATADPAGRARGLRQLLGRFQAVCQAVAYAHTKGVVHRDLKPANVMVGAFGETLVVDWGLAKEVGSAPAGDPAAAADEPGGGAELTTDRPGATDPDAATRAGAVVGTPAYMPPEQAAGRGAEVGPAADVYALGATLYHLLTGRPPVTGGADRAELLGRVRRGEFPRPREANPGVPKALEAVCLKAMAARPENRYPSAAALAEDVDRWLADDPVSAYRDPWAKRVARWTRRHRTLVAAAAVLLVTATAALAVSTALVGRALSREEQARRDRDRAQVVALLGADPRAVPDLLAGLRPLSPEQRGRLREVWGPDGRGGDRRQAVRAGLALLSADDDPGVRRQLFDWLLDPALDPPEMLLLRDQLRPHAGDMAGALWAAATAPDARPEERFRALVALAAFDPDADRWRAAGRPAAEPLLTANPLHLGLWAEALRPVRAALVPPLTEGFRGRLPGRKTEEAATILADYARDRPDVLLDLLLAADARQFELLLPALGPYRPEAVARLTDHLTQVPAPKWADDPSGPDRPPAPPALAADLEGAGGLLHDRFALCQALPAGRFPEVAGRLRAHGYRPTRCRPYPAGGEVRVAAVWARDGREWEVELGLSADRLRERDGELQGKGFRPVDVASYPPPAGGPGGAAYAAVWVRAAGGAGPHRLFVGLTEVEDRALPRKLGRDVVRASYEVARPEDGRPSYSSVWVPGESEVPLPGETGVPLTFAGGEYASNVYPGHLQLDVRVVRPADPEYAAVWGVGREFESTGLHGLGPAEHLARCRELAARGYRPAAVSVAGDPPVCASVWHLPLAREEDKEDLARSQANAAVALLRLGAADPVWPLFRHAEDPRRRSYLVDRAGPYGADPADLVRRLRPGAEPDVSARRALVLSLGEFDGRQLPAGRRGELGSQLLGAYEADPDPGLHSAVGWLLRRWGHGDAVREVDRKLSTGRPEGDRRWYVGRQGQTMAVVRGPDRFAMGSPGSEAAREYGQERLHFRRIDRAFAVAVTEVTVEQFQRFRKEQNYNREFSPEPDCPFNGVSWYAAAAYCNWLSAREGIPEDQWCYPSGPFADGLRPHPDYLSRTGYRLPTEAEWEYAARAGAATGRCYGQSEELLPRYGWFRDSSRDRSWPVGRLKPNDLGLFDVHGNVTEWCQDALRPYPVRPGGPAAADREDPAAILDKAPRVLRGGAAADGPSVVRTAYRDRASPPGGVTATGFRVARTLP